MINGEAESLRQSKKPKRNKILPKKGADKRKQMNTLKNLGAEEMLNENNRKKRTKCLIYPEVKFIQIWDMVIFVMIMYCIVLNPIEIAFINDSKVNYIINVIIDFTFIADIVFTFFRAFENKDNKLIDNHRHIAVNYICGWLLLDMVCAFPYTLVLSKENNVGKIVRISRLTKISKMIRLLRFLRSVKFFNQTDKLPFWLKKLLHQDSFIKGIFRTAVFTLLMIHIVACLWKFAAEFDDEDDRSNWLKEDDYRGLSDFEIYIACVYWAIQTVFTVGYGDFTPFSTFQLIISILAMLFGVFLFGTIISSISNIFESMHNHSIETISLLDNLYKFRGCYNIDDQLYQRCIEYILNRKSDVEEDYKTLFKSLPSEVRKAMNKEIYKKKYADFEYFKDKTEEFLGEIGPKLEFIGFNANDQILNKGDDAEEVYFLKKGVVMVLDKNHDNVLMEFGEGSVFGEWDIFFNNSIRQFFVTAKTKCELFFITKKDFDQIFFQKFTNESNRLMNYSKNNYYQMIEKEKEVLNPLEVSFHSDDSDDDLPSNQNNFNLTNIVKSSLLGKLAGTFKEKKEFREMLYLQDLNNQIKELQQRLDDVNQKLATEH